MSCKKVCKSCLVEKSVDRFYRKRDSRGRSYINSYCMICSRKKASARYHKNNRFMEAHNLSKAEVICAKRLEGLGPWQISQKDAQMFRINGGTR